MNLEPNGGNFYRPSMMMVHSGLFWRCKHGRTKLKGPCVLCAIKDPVAALRWYGWLKRT